jgi:hypothetical protein
LLSLVLTRKRAHAHHQEIKCACKRTFSSTSQLEAHGRECQAHAAASASGAKTQSTTLVSAADDALPLDALTGGVCRVLIVDFDVRLVVKLVINLYTRL